MDSTSKNQSIIVNAYCIQLWLEISPLTLLLSCTPMHTPGYTHQTYTQSTHNTYKHQTCTHQTYMHQTWAYINNTHTSNIHTHQRHTTSTHQIHQTHIKIHTHKVYTHSIYIYIKVRLLKQRQTQDEVWWEASIYLEATWLSNSRPIYKILNRGTRLRVKPRVRPTVQLVAPSAYTSGPHSTKWLT